MTYRAFPFVLLLLPLLAGPASARDIPPVDLELSGQASPELLADLRQALQRQAKRHSGNETTQALAVSSGRVDLDQFWKVEEDLPYTQNDDSPRQRLNIVYPFEGEPPYRFIVHFHSGDWHSGSKESAADAAAYWAIYQGYALVNVGYRLADEATWPAQLHDAKAAIRFLRANADQYQLDASRILAWGHASGGHLAQMLAATNGNPSAEDRAMGHGETSSEVQGVASWYGVSDITAMAPGSRDAADGLLGYPAYQGETGLEASPVARVDDDFPPILLVHGTNDQVIPFEQSARMAIRVNAATGREQARLNLLINGGHGDSHIARPEVMADSLDFVDTILYPDDENPHRSSFYPGIQTISEPGEN